MVALTVTPAIVAAAARLTSAGEQSIDDLNLEDVKVGKGIGHADLIAMSKRLKRLQDNGAGEDFSLQSLLRGCDVYTPEPPPKPPKTTEYVELMARLRRDQEARQYERMTDPTRPAQHASFQIGSTQAPEDDEMTYGDIKRQLTLIINVLVSIFACAIAIWMLAWHWPAPGRLALSMTGGGAVGIAEVVIYAAYISKIKDAKAKEQRMHERKTVTETWVIERNASGHRDAVSTKKSSRDELLDGVRKRVAKSKLTDS